LVVSPRPLVLVCALTAGDYLLWNWSLSGNRDVLALVSGLTLPPLAAACLLLLALTAARAASGLTRRSVGPAMSRRTAARARMYASSSRPISASDPGAGEPGVALDGAGASASAVQDHAQLDGSGRPRSPVGRSPRPARKIAA
jgi:hypothetical protein